MEVFEVVEALLLGGAALARRRPDPFTIPIARLAYAGDGGPELAYRFEWR